MSLYSRMIERMAGEMPENFRKTLQCEDELIAFLKEGEDEVTDSFHPDSQEAMKSTLYEGQQMDAALHTWKHLTPEERKRVEAILRKAGHPDPDDDLYYDLTTRLQ